MSPIEEFVISSKPDLLITKSLKYWVAYICFLNSEAFSIIHCDRLSVKLNCNFMFQNIFREKYIV